MRGQKAIIIVPSPRDIASALMRAHPQVTERFLLEALPPTVPSCCYTCVSGCSFSSEELSERKRS